MHDACGIGRSWWCSPTNPGSSRQADIGWTGYPELVLIVGLVLAGVAVNSLVVLQGENPWELLDAVEEAARGRVHLASRNVKEVFDLLDKLMVRATDELRRARIQRP